MENIFTTPLNRLVMRSAVTILLYFMSFWGFIAVWILGENDFYPNQWYIIIPLIVLASAWAYLFKYIADRYRER